MPPPPWDIYYAGDIIVTEPSPSQLLLFPVDAQSSDNQVKLHTLLHDESPSPHAVLSRQSSVSEYSCVTVSNNAFLILTVLFRESSFECKLMVHWKVPLHILSCPHTDKLH